MCVVSAMGDHFRDHFKGWEDKIKTAPYPYQHPLPNPVIIPQPPAVSKEEFDALKKEVEEMKKILIVAKLYDERNNEPHCEMEEKVDFIKKLAKFVGVDLEEVFGNEE